MGMTAFERVYSMAEPGMPVLHRRVRHELMTLLQKAPADSKLLDVGGRASQYTIGLPARVTLIDLPRETSQQTNLHLGLSPRALRILRTSRSNIDDVIVGNVLHFDFGPRHFDAIVAVEVIEHIQDDQEFVRRLRELVNDDGWVFLTTPNGDYVKNDPPHHNPDHVRHYRRHELQSLLEEQFEDVIVTYAIQTGKNRVAGLKISPRRPLGIPRAAWANRLNERESRFRSFTPERSAHLIAVARPRRPA